jgi:hypothetical protein
MIDPPTRALPGNNRIIAKLVADFPDPDSPTNPSVSPGAIANEIPRTASAPPNEIRSPSTRSNGIISPASCIPKA